jgi:hypothetical protein
MKWIGAIVALVMVYLFYGIFLNNFDLSVIPSELSASDPPGFHDYAGIINVHTNASTGSASPENVILAGQEAGLDYLFITDLNQFDPAAKRFEGYHNNLLVFVDGEYTYLNSRLLNIGVSTPRDLLGPGRAQVFFADVLGQTKRPRDQGLFVLAHPLKPKYTWVGEFPVGLDGIELVNLKSIWQEAWLRSRWSFFWSLVVFPFNDRLALLRLFRDPRGEVELWDNLSSRRPTLGFAGADAEAHIRIFGKWGLKYPSYETLFSLVRNHVMLTTELTGNAEDDRNKILSALAKGQFYVSLDILGDPKGFLATLTNRHGDVFPLGAKVAWQEGLNLHVHLPQRPTVPFEVEIYRDGERVVQANSQDTRIPLHAPGIYRVKVRVIPTLPLPDGKKWIPWIYTNPFYVR